MRCSYSSYLAYLSQVNTKGRAPPPLFKATPTSPIGVSYNQGDYFPVVPRGRKDAKTKLKSLSRQPSHTVRRPL